MPLPGERICEDCGWTCHHCGERVSSPVMVPEDGHIYIYERGHEGEGNAVRRKRGSEEAAPTRVSRVQRVRG